MCIDVEKKAVEKEICREYICFFFSFMKTLMIFPHLLSWTYNFALISAVIMIIILMSTFNNILLWWVYASLPFSINFCSGFLFFGAVNYWGYYSFDADTIFFLINYYSRFYKVMDIMEIMITMRSEDKEEKKKRKQTFM